jgi:DNA polymerase-3 subunit delta
LSGYAKNPQPQTVLILCYKYKDFDRSTALYKAIDKQGITFKSPVVYDNQLPAYIKDIAKEKKLQMAEDATQLLAAHIGTDLSRIDNELTKLIAVLPPRAEITVQIIESYIGISKEYNNYELVNAVLSRNEEKAYHILHYFACDGGGSSRKPLISSLYYAFFTLLQYHYSPDKSDAFLRSMQVNYYVIPIYKRAAAFYHIEKIFRIMHWLKQYDLMNKGASGVNIDECEWVKELLFKIFKT